jgi:DNA transformation protein
VDAEYLAFVREQMAGFGPVSLRRMFGGAGIFRDGLMFALVAGGTLHFKADAASRADFEAENLKPFSYETKNGERTLTSYWRAPERCFDDPDEMTLWCRKAYDAALRANAPSKKRKVRVNK